MQFKKIIFNYYVATIVLIVAIIGVALSKKPTGFIISGAFFILAIVNFIITIKERKKKIVNPYAQEPTQNLPPENHFENPNTGEGSIHEIPIPYQEKQQDDINKYFWIKESKSLNLIVLKYRKRWKNLWKINHDEVLIVCELMLRNDYKFINSFEDAKKPYFYFQRIRSEDVNMHKPY